MLVTRNKNLLEAGGGSEEKRTNRQETEYWCIYRTRFHPCCCKGCWEGEVLPGMVVEDVPTTLEAGGQVLHSVFCLVASWALVHAWGSTGMKVN